MTRKGQLDEEAKPYWMRMASGGEMVNKRFVKGQCVLYRGRSCRVFKPSADGKFITLVYTEGEDQRPFEAALSEVTRTRQGEFLNTCKEALEDDPSE